MIRATPGSVETEPRRDRAAMTAVVLLASLVAIASARDYAGGWNDGSRLATVESLVDRGTLSIGDSIFVRPSPRSSPYPATEPDLVARGTQDKIRIGERFYSDKPPLPAILMAGSYLMLRSLIGLDAESQPRRFCWWMTVTSSGVAYVVAAVSIFTIAGAVGLATWPRSALTASFALATMALPYSRHVNGHILLLAVAGLLFVCVARFGRRSTRSAHALAIGTLAGLGFAIDVGAGSMLLLSAIAWTGIRCRRLSAVGVVLAGAAPWVLAHQAINYSIAGTMLPANAVAENLAWPGSPFTPGNMTGTLRHTPAHFVEYAASLLLGKRGFLGHDLPLLLAVAGGVVLVRHRAAELPEIVFAAAWSTSTWLLYAASSTNSSGACASVRWFVPLLVPGYYVIALVLRDHPRTLADLALLSGWGSVIALLAWRVGPWTRHLVPLYWPVVAAAAVSWTALARWRRSSRSAHEVPLAERAAISS